MGVGYRGVGNRWWAMVRVLGVALRLELRNDGGSGGNDLRGDIGEGEDGGELLISDVNFTLHSAFILYKWYHIICLS